MNLIEIDINVIASKLFPQKTLSRVNQEPIRLSKDVRLWRFDAQEAGGSEYLHLLTDGAGGYRAITHPGTGAEQEQSGHLADFK